MSQPAGKTYGKTVFWISVEIFLIDYKDKGVSPITENYTLILEQLKKRPLEKKSREIWQKSVLLLYDKFPREVVGLAPLHKLDFVILNHPSYIPDLPREIIIPFQK